MLKRIKYISRCNRPLDGAGITALGERAVERTIRPELRSGD